MAADHWPLVGRESACEAITATLAELPVGGTVIAGRAGVGRTRMLREAVTLAEQSSRPTRWATATATAAQVSLGALAHLLPTMDASDPLVLIQRARQAIAGDGSGPRPVLAVDDVHLLDPLSVTLIHQLATSGAVTLVLSVRTGDALPDPAAPLWKDGLATRIELQPLDRRDTERLINEALNKTLAGCVETRTVERLWRLGRGNPLYLRELVQDGRRTGRLSCSRGLWRWDGDMAPSERLTEIVLAEMGGLSAGEWRALDVLAAAQPLTVDRVMELSGGDAIASLERRGVVVDDAGSGGIRIAHPLVTEVIRSRSSVAALRLVRREVASEGTGDGVAHDLLRRGVGLLDGEVRTVDAPMLTDAAQRAGAMLDHALAERLAQTAVRSGGGARAYLTLVEAAWWQGQPARGDRFAVEASSVAATDDDRAWLTAARVLTLFCGLGRRDDAMAVLREGAGLAPSEPARAVLDATEAMLAFLCGDPAGAARKAAWVLSSGAPVGAALPLAAAAAASGLAATGQAGQARATAATGWRALDSDPNAFQSAFARIALAQAEMLALHVDGRMHELEARAAELHSRNLTAPEWSGDGIACLHRGWAALAGGRLPLSIRWLEEALAGLERADPAGLLRLCRCLLATARAIVGDTSGARALLGELEQPPPGVATAFDAQEGLARAWLAATEGRRAEAGQWVMEAARFAEEQGQCAVEALMLHQALRFGHGPEVVDRLGELAGTVGSPFGDLLAAHAEAAVAGDGDRLDQVSRRFEDTGALLFAADAAAGAAAAYQRTGARREAAAATNRAVRLTGECGLTESPAHDLLTPPTLTEREHEVGRMAGRGLSNQAIAERLVVSVRTVEAHLSHVYSKLGISGRADLASALAPLSARSRMHEAGRVPGQGRQAPRGLSAG
jgi:DNA-binding CsgD family transcriptional regulator/tetratricopeptide (TPR) repeat protein